MRLPLAGRTVSRVAFDHAVSLLTDDGAELRVQTAFSFGADPARMVVIDPERDVAAHAGVLVDLRGRAITAAGADDDGALAVRFATEAVLQVPPDSSYEAWTLTGPQGSLVVCLPGGGVAVFEPD